MFNKFIVLCAIVVLLTAAVACAPSPTPVPTPTPVPATRTPEPAKPGGTPTLKNPPMIPANHASYTECLNCHQTGTNNSPRVPLVPDHTAPTGTKVEATVCNQCHVVAK